MCAPLAAGECVQDRYSNSTERTKEKKDEADEERGKIKRKMLRHNMRGKG